MHKHHTQTPVHLPKYSLTPTHANTHTCTNTYTYTYIYIYKTVVSDRVLTLNRLYAYPSAVPPTCLWPDGCPKFVKIVLSVHQIVAPGIVEMTVLQKANLTQPLKNQQLYFENEAFLIKRFFVAHFRGFMVRSVYVSKSTHSRIDHTLSVRRIVMSCFRPDESPKFGIVLRSSNRRSRDRRNHVVPESKPNPASPQLYFEKEAFFWHFLSKCFFSTLSWFRAFRGFVVWSVQVSKSDRPCIDRTLSVRTTVREHALWSCSSSQKILAFPASQNPRPQLYFENVSFFQRGQFCRNFSGSVCQFFGDLSGKKIQNRTAHDRSYDRMIDRNDV